MTIYGTSVHFGIVGPRSRSHILFYTNVNSDSIWEKFAFQHYRSKIKVTVAYEGGIRHLH